MLAVSGVLLVIIMSGRFVSYLAKAASGDLSADAILTIMALRLPGFLELILPLGLFLGILLGYGRVYLDSEMAVLSASGMSQRRLIVYAMGPGLVTACIVASMSLYLTPLSADNISQLLQEQEARSEVDRLTPGRFQVQSDGRVTYVESVSEDGHLAQVFLAQRGNKDGELVALLAESGQRQLIDQQGYIVLENGHRYEGRPGEFAYTDTAFDQYGIRIKNNVLTEETSDIETQTTESLIGMTDAQSVAQLHWRFSLPVMALVVALIAVPLSKVNPRQGRYAKLVPSILIYLLYLTLLSSVRSRIEEGDAQALHLWIVHGCFVLFAMNLILLGRFWARLFNKVPVFRFSLTKGNQA